MTQSEKTIVDLPYGDSLLRAELPTDNLVSVLRRQASRPVADETEAVRRSLKNPIGSPPLDEIVGKNDKVAVLITDNTRACPDHKLLPVILGEIESRTSRQNITVIVALGLHQPLDKDELIKKCGRDIVENYRVINHDINDVINIGTTSRGTPVEIFREVVEADIVVSTGFIEPHFFAGFSGGRKSIAPGVSGRSSIYSNHSYPMLDHEYAHAGFLQGNPIHEDMVEMAGMADLKFIVNVLLDENGEITHVFSGDPVLAHEKGCSTEKQLASAGIDSPVDITIVTCGGAPLDLDLYQTCKAVDTAVPITKSGGIIIVASLCNTGVGPDSFYELHSSSASPSEVLERIQQQGATGVPWQNQVLARAQLEHEVYLVSGLEPEPVRKMMITPVSYVGEGVSKALEKSGDKAGIAVIPQGPHVIPYVK